MMVALNVSWNMLGMRPDKRLLRYDIVAYCCCCESALLLGKFEIKVPNNKLYEICRSFHCLFWMECGMVPVR